MPRRIVSRSELARLAGVSPAAITKLCRAGNPLARGCVGDRLDLDAACVQKWLKRTDGPRKLSRGARVKRAAKRTAPRRKTRKKHSKADLLLDDLGAYMRLTLGEIIERHGTIRVLKDLLEARAKIAAIQERELGMSESRTELIKRDMVRLHVIGAFDGGHRRLLSDACETLARRLYAASTAGLPLEEGKRIAREIIGAQLELAKSQAAKALLDGDDA